MQLEFCDFQVNDLGVCVYQIGEAKLIFNNELNWLVSYKNETLSFFELNNPQPLYFLYPLFEADKALVYAHLNAVAQRYLFKKEISTDFPELVIMQHVLEHSVTDYWPLKALEWLESSSNFNVQIKDQLNALHQKSWASQKLKHKARFLLKKFS